MIKCVPALKWANWWNFILQYFSVIVRLKQNGPAPFCFPDTLSDFFLFRHPSNFFTVPLFCECFTHFLKELPWFCSRSWHKWLKFIEFHQWYREYKCSEEFPLFHQLQHAKSYRIILLYCTKHASFCFHLENKFVKNHCIATDFNIFQTYSLHVNHFGINDPWISSHHMSRQ